MIEPIRGCGFRKVGGVYLIGTGMAVPCDRLPLPLEVCPVCGQGIKVTTGFTTISPTNLFGGEHKNCSDIAPKSCPVCNPEIAEEKAVLMWVGSKFYSPQSFIEESEKMGVSKRIPFIPKDLNIGEAWIYLAHKEAGLKPSEKKPITKKFTTNQGLKGIVTKYPPLKSCPAIFYAFKPTGVEKLIWKKDATDKNLEDLKKRGITPVVIPDGDPDHDPKRSVWVDIKKIKKQMEMETKK